MFKLNHKSYIAPVFLAAGILAAQPGLAASASKAPEGATDKVEKAATIVARKIISKSALADAVKKTRDSMTAEQKRAVEDAVATLQAVQKAIGALDKKDGKAAMKYLERAIGKIEVVLAIAPEMSLAPVGISSDVVDTQTSVKEIRKITNDAIALLKDGRLQDARPLVASLASELVIHVSEIPLETYPAAIKSAVPLIQKGKLKKARDVLATAMSTIVVENHVIPLPVVRAEAYLKRAEVLAEKAKRSSKEEKELAGILKNARSQVELAEALGYGKAADFKHIYKQIAEISEKTRGGKYGKGFFDGIKKSLSSLKSRLF
ncbi:MAG TPA: YfdX family protein [Rhizobiales bacterium]|nr:YfdX family protein [Hyphomicrobiales bacterium]